MATRKEHRERTGAVLWWGLIGFSVFLYAALWWAAYNQLPVGWFAFLVALWATLNGVALKKLGVWPVVSANFVIFLVFLPRAVEYYF